MKITPTKVLIVNTLYTPNLVGGAERSVQSLAEGLVCLGLEVRVVCFHNKPEREVNNINGVDVIYLPHCSTFWPFDKGTKRGKLTKIIWHLHDYYNFKAKSLLKNEIENFKPDCLHTNNLGCFSISAWDAVDTHIPIIHTARDYYLFEPKGSLFYGKIVSPSNPLILLWSWFRKFKSKKVSYFIGISDFIKGIHIDFGFFKYSKSKTIYNGVKRLPTKNTELDNKRQNITIGFIGSLNRHKGFDKFCEIARLEQFSNINFTAAGSIDRLDSSIDYSGVELVGFVEIEEYLKTIDVLLLPIKWNEPFGRVIIECAQANIPVYTNPLGGAAELVEIVNNVFDISQLSLNHIKYSLKIESNLKHEFSEAEVARKYRDIILSLTN